MPLRWNRGWSRVVRRLRHRERGRASRPRFFHGLGRAVLRQSRIMKPNRLILLAALACVSTVLAVDPPPDGGYPNENTAEGEDALFNLGPLAGENTALGFRALYSSTFCSQNTAVGDRSLYYDTSGSYNTAVGWYSLNSNTTGDENVALGYFSLVQNTTGEANVAIGIEAMTFNTTGYGNVAIGARSGGGGTGDDNVAIGDRAMANTDKGSFNTAVGYSALSYCTGSHNIGLGQVAGVRLTTGSYNIDIGSHGMANDKKTIRIGNGVHQRAFIAGVSGVTVADGVPVVVNADGQLGVMTSTARLKEAVRPMDATSTALYALQPVTFHYKKELDSKATPQFGLVAEQVAKVDPDLVVRDDEGKPYTVRYEAVNAMLLNEFLKEHRKVEAQGREIAALRAAVEAQAAQLQAIDKRLDEAALPPRLVENR